MEAPQNDLPPPAESATGSPPVLPYHVSEKTEARWGMPRSAQIIFGVLFFFTSAGIIALAIAAAGPLAIVIFVGLILIAVYVRREWKWPGFAMGFFLAIGASILTAGICAVVAFN